MPPRAEFDDHQSCYDDTAVASDALAASASTLFALLSSSVNLSNKTPSQSSILQRKRGQQRQRKRRPRIVFRNTHGISGLLSSLLVCIAIGAHHVYIIPNTLSILAAIASVATASSGMNIVDQAPKQTVVMEWPFKVIPPHRDAFKRTAYSIYYLCGRICWNTIQYHHHQQQHSATKTTTTSVLNWIWGISALIYAMTKFVPNPRDLDLSNGNTWLFVIPMAIGLTVDAFFQLPMLSQEDQLRWNEDVITQVDLLWILLVGLIVAFVFTLAFRGVLGIRKCYWMAAILVHAIVIYLIVKALPFVMQLVL
ncbi:hypothetical protein ACHAWC_003473 [Mediolabrus comicus]